MPKNHNHAPLYLCLILVSSLLILYNFPEFSIGSWKFKRIDILADIKTFEEEKLLQAASDSAEHEQDSIVQLVVERCRPGVTCIEDYSGDSTALNNFLKALVASKKKSQPVRIAFYGDSFIEGDIFAGSFRDTLQSVYGGKGVGFVPITSGVTYFRKTIRHKFDNWYTSSIVTKKDSSLLIGPAGYCFVPLEGNWVEYKTTKQKNLNEFNAIKLYYTNTDEAAVLYSVNNDTTLNIDELKINRELQEWSFQGDDINSIKFEFYPHESLNLYGAVFEGRDGISVDNFSLRGNTGISLSGINERLLSNFNRYRDYKLVILQFGLNSVTEDTLNYRGYTKRMVAVVNRLKKAFPKTSFLLLSVGDRSSNKGGRLQTMNAIPAMRNAQRAIAQKTKIAFWDMYEAMGGHNSMVKFAQARPPMAAKDYTHLTFKGGEKLSSALAKSLLFEVEKFEKKTKPE